MKNQILNIIIQKATLINEPGKVEEFKKRLQMATGASSQRMTKLLHNKEQPTEDEQEIIAAILKTKKTSLFETPPPIKRASEHL